MLSEERQDIGELLDSFLKQVSHPRGKVLKLLTESSITVPQVIVLDQVRANRNCTPTELSATMKVSLPSASQMVDRLVKQKLLLRVEDAQDRRRKVISLTPKAKRFLTRFQSARHEEFTAGMARLSASTRKALGSILSVALEELNATNLR
jgi:MarR family transcriptional regulator, organic hydroperoxide resistance regulator